MRRLVSVRTDRAKYLLSFDNATRANPHERLFDLRADPGEHAPRAFDPSSAAKFGDDFLGVVHRIRAVIEVPRPEVGVVAR